MRSALRPTCHNKQSAVIHERNGAGGGEREEQDEEEQRDRAVAVGLGGDSGMNLVRWENAGEMVPETAAPEPADYPPR